jgi:signal recognition particle receptor subunit beta
MARIRVMSPIGEVAQERFTSPPFPESWKGGVVGFIDNTKHNFDLLAEGLGALLRERYEVRAVVHRRKANASTPAPPELIAEMAKQCDVVFAGSGD